MSLVDIARHAGDHAARIVLPIGRVKTGKGRHKVHATIVFYRLCQHLHFGRASNQSEVVAQPLHQRTRNRNRPFQRIDRRLAGKLIAHRRQQTVLGVHGLGAGVEQHKTTRTIRILRLAGSKTRLPYGRRLLVT